MRVPLLLSVCAGVTSWAAGPAAPQRLELWYDRPAQYWEEALPVGNGRIGAMVHGGVSREHIQLNEETIWSGAPTPAVGEVRSAPDGGTHRVQFAVRAGGRYRVEAMR